MNITREHFDDDRLVLMDEIAVLMLACQTLRAAGVAFENTEDINEQRTLATAKPIFKFLTSTAADLLQAAFAGKTRRAKLTKTAHEKALIELTHLMPSIEKLARQEIAAYEDGNRNRSALGTTIRDLVLSPLAQQLSVWSLAQR